MSERIRGSYDDALYKSTFTLLYVYFTCVAMMQLVCFLFEYMLNYLKSIKCDMNDANADLIISLIYETYGYNGCSLLRRTDVDLNVH